MHTTCRSLPVCAPMIIAAPDLAFYECLCKRLLHPPSTMTEIAGTPSWNDPLSMAFLFFSPAASSCSPQATPAMTDQEPSWSSPAPPARHRLSEWCMTFTGRHLPTDGCQVALPPLTPPPPQGQSPWKRWGMQPPCDSCYRWC